MYWLFSIACRYNTMNGSDEPRKSFLSRWWPRNCTSNESLFSLISSPIKLIVPDDKAADLKGGWNVLGIRTNRNYISLNIEKGNHAIWNSCNFIDIIVLPFCISPSRNGAWRQVLSNKEEWIWKSGKEGQQRVSNRIEGLHKLDETIIWSAWPSFKITGNEWIWVWVGLVVRTFDRLVVWWLHHSVRPSGFPTK